jgi:cell division protein FtsA
MPKKDNIIVGLDIGTTKISAVVGEVTGGDIHVVGFGTSPSVGLRKGVVVNIESTVESIKKAVEEAEMMAGCEISAVYAGIAGSHIMGLNSRGIVAIKGREVNPSDVERVKEAARAVAIPLDREVIHVLPQEYLVDDQSGITNPVGMSGVRLEAKIHIVTGAVSSVHNIIKCANRSGLDVFDIVLESMASGEAVLSEAEKDQGVVLIDIGGGTSDMAIFSGKNIRHTYVLPLGGNNLTNDIAIGIRAPLAEAEMIKKTYGTCISEGITPEEMITIQGSSGRKPRTLPRQILAEILEMRMAEIFRLLRKEILRAGMDDVVSAGSGIVITGGSAMLDGAVEAAESVFSLPVRVGHPQGISGLVDVVNNPMHATGVGLVLYGARHQHNRKFHVKDKNIFSRIFRRMEKWFRDAV